VHRHGRTPGSSPHIHRGGHEPGLIHLEVEMELVIMSLGGSLIALCLQLSELIGGRTVYAPVHAAPGIGAGAGPCESPARLSWKALFVLIAAALL